MEEKNKKEYKSTSSLRYASIAFAFLVIGYECALFIERAKYTVVEPALEESAPPSESPSPQAAKAESSTGADVRAGSEKDIRQKKDVKTGSREKHVPAKKERKSERFVFNPNTISRDSLCLLGFSEKQATSIINYREKGGRFHRKADFASSFVVSEEMYSQLQSYIDIPAIDINAADSAELVSLPGIGPYFASKIIEHRQKLGGYSSTAQLMDIYHLDQAKYDALADLVVVCKPYVYPLWSLSEEELAKHPYIRKRQTAHSIVLFRNNNPPDSLSIDALRRAGAINEETYGKMSNLLIK